MKKVTLPSGKELRIDMAPFADAKELYQSVLVEMSALKISDMDDIDVNLFKNVFCSLLSSKKVEENIWLCMGRAVYDKEKITKDSFESEEARGDYIVICGEVAWFNIFPFAKGLYAKLSPIMEMLGKLKNFQE